MMIDQVILEFDKALRTLAAPAPTSREVPGAALPEADMNAAEKRHAAGLMRVNHCGEICAQALYQGQRLTSRDAQTRDALAKAEYEETEHLNWTEQRLAELGSRKSLLNPLWYVGSLALGVAAGKLGDEWSLGFLAETEDQVEQHLARHLGELPAQDQRSRQIVEQMKTDEAAHAAMARRFGARELPGVAKMAMRAMSRVMTRTAYYV